MACGCGQRGVRSEQQAARQMAAVRVNEVRVQAALFQYVGRTKLAAVGQVTRRVYRFDIPGAKVIVDGRDVASLASGCRC